MVSSFRLLSLVRPRLHYSTTIWLTMTAFMAVGADQPALGAERPVLQLRAMWSCCDTNVQILPLYLLLVRPHNLFDCRLTAVVSLSSADHRSLDWDGIHEKICGAVSVIRGPAAGKVGSDEERAARENELHDFRVSLSQQACRRALCLIP